MDVNRFGRFYGIAGNRYTISLCGGTADTQAYITTNTTIPGVINCDDDGCGIEDGPSQLDFVPQTTGSYRLYVFDGGCGSMYPAQTQMEVSITCTSLSTIPNDFPCDAIALPINGDICNFTMADNSPATNSSGPGGIGNIPVPACVGAYYQGSDLWFTVEVPPSGHIGINTEEGTLCAGAFQFYTTTDCANGGTFTPLPASCTTVGLNGPDSPPAIQFDATQLTVGETVYIRYWERHGNELGTFGICAYEAIPTCDAEFEIVQSMSGNLLIPFTFHIVNPSTGVPPISYSWDNIPSTDAEPSHVIQTNGEETVYTLCLTITGADGCTSTHCDTVFVDLNGVIHQEAPAPCEPAFAVEQIAPFTAQLINTTTGFALAGANWVLPNNGSGSGDTITYTFNGVGTYQVCMTPIGYGCGPVCHQIIVNADGNISTEPCQAGFWVIQAFEYDGMGDPVPVPYHLWVWDISSGDGGLDHFWDFGDGNTSTESYPMHIYASSGPYEICLTISDGSGCTDTYCDSISVNDDGMLGMMQGGNDRNALTINVLPNMPLGLQIDPGVDEVKVWPNPASALLNISIGSSFKGNTTVTILDLNGRVVRIMDRSFNRGANMITIPIADLADGMYSIRIESGGGMFSYRFVKR